MLKNIFFKYPKNNGLKILFLALFLAIGALPTKPAINAAADNDNNDAFVLTWSSNSYIPPGYDGLAMPTSGCQIKVFVLPARRIGPDPDKLTYNWFLDDAAKGWASGQGKTVFSFPATKWASDYHAVKVRVSNNGNLVWQGAAAIKISAAQAIFKLNDNVYAAQDIISASTGQTVKIIGLPFFFNANRLTDLSFQWQINGQDIADSVPKDANPNIFSLVIPTGQIKKTLIKNLVLLVTDKNDDSGQTSSRIILEIKNEKNK